MSFPTGFFALKTRFHRYGPRSRTRDSQPIRRHHHPQTARGNVYACSGANLRPGARAKNSPATTTTPDEFRITRIKSDLSRSNVHNNIQNSSLMILDCLLFRDCFMDFSCSRPTAPLRAPGHLPLLFIRRYPNYGGSEFQGNR